MQDNLDLQAPQGCKGVGVGTVEFRTELTAVQSLKRLQLQSRSDTRCYCTLKCHEGYEIPVHLLPLRQHSWGLKTSLENDALPDCLPSLDLALCKVKDLAPFVLLLYSDDSLRPAMKLSPTAMLALTCIKVGLSANGINISIPEAKGPIKPVEPSARFRCVKVTPQGRKNFHYIVSEEKFVEAFDCEDARCFFSGSAEELSKHRKDCHGTNTCHAKVTATAGEEQESRTFKLPLQKKPQEKTRNRSKSGGVPPTTAKDRPRSAQGIPFAAIRNDTFSFLTTPPVPLCSSTPMIQNKESQPRSHKLTSRCRPMEENVAEIKPALSWKDLNP